MKSYLNPAGWLLLVGILVTLISLPYSQAFWFWPGNGNKIKTGVFLSPKFELGPGSVENNFFYNVDFPRGHIALKSFQAEVVDDAGNPIPLYETYMHHWAIVRYYERIGDGSSDYNISGRNGGICQDEVLGQFFGSGSETRKTSSHVPDPYGIEVGNPSEIPSGFEEKWFINVHAIDVRGVEDKLGCMECWCDLYNVTIDEYGKPLSPDYKGGLLCCYDGTQCRLKQGFQGNKRTLHLKYTVQWMDMDSSVLPVKVYILDVSDTWKRSKNSTGTNAEHDCKVEYQVIESCGRGLAAADDDGRHGCVDNKRIRLDMPFSGYVIYGVAHQHTTASGSALYREVRIEINLNTIFVALICTYVLNSGRSTSVFFNADLWGRGGSRK